MSDFRKYLEKQLENEEFKMEHEATRAEFEEMVQALAKGLNKKLIIGFE